MFTTIKSIVSNLICKAVCLGQARGIISQEELNRLANKYTDKILEELQKGSKNEKR